MADSILGHYVFRNRWQDADDCIVAVLVGARGDKLGGRNCRIKAWGLQDHVSFGNLGKGETTFFRAAEDGSGVVASGANCIGVDFSKASGADGLVVMVGPAASGGQAGSHSKIVAVTAGGQTFQILIFGTTPEPRADGDQVVIGKQSIRYDGGKLVFAVMAGEPKLKL